MTISPSRPFYVCWEGRGEAALGEGQHSQTVNDIMVASTGEAVDPLTTFNIAISVALLSVASVMEIDRP